MAVMLSWIILILVLALLSIVGVRVFAGVFGRGEALPPMPPTEEVKEANRRAVEEGNYGDIQLEVVHRGYRMDQVDALIAQLTGQEPDADGETRVELSETTETVRPVDADGVEAGAVDTVVTSEGAMTHGSDETAHR